MQEYSSVTEGRIATGMLLAILSIVASVVGLCTFVPLALKPENHIQNMGDSIVSEVCIFGAIVSAIGGLIVMPRRKVDAVSDKGLAKIAIIARVAMAGVLVSWFAIGIIREMFVSF